MVSRPVSSPPLNCTFPDHAINHHPPSYRLTSTVCCSCSPSSYSPTSITTTVPALSPTPPFYAVQLVPTKRSLSLFKTTTPQLLRHQHRQASHSNSPWLATSHRRHSPSTPPCLTRTATTTSHQLPQPPPRQPQPRTNPPAGPSLRRVRARTSRAKVPATRVPSSRTRRASPGRERRPGCRTRWMRMRRLALLAKDSGAKHRTVVCRVCQPGACKRMRG